MQTARTLRRALCATLVALAACAESPTSPVDFLPHFAVGDVLIVTNTDDDGPGSLRQALLDATNGAIITFAPAIAGQTILLESELFTTHKTITIEGPADQGIALSGGGTTRILNATSGSLVNPTDVTLRNLTITGGNGGAIINTENTTIRIENTTLTRNATAGGGGAISSGGDLTLVNSTVSGNEAGVTGGGIQMLGGSSLTLINSTVTDNTAVLAGGIYEIVTGANSNITFQNSIIANNNAQLLSDCDIFSPPVLEGLNITTSNICGAGAFLADPQLQPLADNGGPNHTHALDITSPAIDAATGCTVTEDQRHVSRPFHLACDVGAFEFNGTETVTLVIDENVTVNPNTGVAVMTGTIRCTAPDQFNLVIRLAQTQKNGRVTSVVQSRTVGLLIVCHPGVELWAAAVSASSGAFRNGSATATVETFNTPIRVIPAVETRDVRLFWGKK